MGSKVLCGICVCLCVPLSHGQNIKNEIYSVAFLELFY